MKKATLKELENKIRENIACFYAKAYAVTGNREEAEALTEKAVFDGAKRYGDLMNKARFFDLLRYIYVEFVSRQQQLYPMKWLLGQLLQRNILPKRMS